MSTFLNTEQSYSNSGTSATWLAANPSMLLSRNSGGLVNVAGPIVIKAIYATTVSGYVGGSASGCVLVAAHAVSGATSGGGAATGDVLYYWYGGGTQANVGSGYNVIGTTPPALGQLDFLARSGLSTFVGNSGYTNAYLLNVLYQPKQA